MYNANASNEKEVKISDVIDMFHELSEKNQMFILGCMTIMQADSEESKAS